MMKVPTLKSRFKSTNKPCSFSTGHTTSQQPIRPSFMDYFDKQDSNKASQQQENYNHNQPQEQPGYHIQSKNVFPDNWKVPQDGDFDFVSNLFLLHFISSSNPHISHVGNYTLTKTKHISHHSDKKYRLPTNFLLLHSWRTWTLKSCRCASLPWIDPMMEREIEELRQRYTAKRQPILDAMDAKKRRQQNFWGLHPIKPFVWFL